MAAGQWFRRQFVIFELVLHLQRAFEDGLQRRHHFGRLQVLWLKEQAVAPVLDIGDDPLGTRGERIIGVVSRLLIFCPVAAFFIQHKAVLVLILAPHPARVETPEGGGMPISGRCQRLLALLYHARAIRWTPLVFAEAHRRADLEAQAHALLFIGVDLIAALGRHVLQAEEALQRLPQFVAAALADIKSPAGDHRMQVAAVLALFGLARQQVLVLFDRSYDAVDQVARTLVIDDSPWPKLRYGQETRPRQVFVALLVAPPWNIGRERQARGILARPEALAGRVTITVEVRLLQALEIGEQRQLPLPLPPQPVALLLVFGAARGIADHAVLRLGL